MINLMQGDCIERLQEIPDGSVDMILTDPPYNMIAPEWDKIIDLKKVWEQIERVRKNDGAVCLFSSQPFTTTLISSNIKNYKYTWYWLKNQGTNFFHAKRMPIRKIEEVNVFYKGKYNYIKTEGHPPTNSASGSSNGKAYHGENRRNYKGGNTSRYPTNVLEYKCVSNYSRFHPSQKPVELIEYLIRTYTNEGETVLDFTMGSGTTGVACVNTNRNFIGIELDQGYFDIAEKRINDVLDAPIKF